MLPAISAVLLCGCGTAGSEKGAGNDSVQESAQSSEETTETASSQTAFETVDLEGNEVSEAVFSESRLTMVNVWATYCNPCLSEMPGLGELAEEYAPEEFQIIGIISDVPEGSGQEMTQLAEDLIEQTGADYVHLLLNQSLYEALLTGVSAVPTTFFVDENGVVLDTVVGAREKSAWEEQIDALLEE